MNQQSFIELQASTLKIKYPEEDSGSLLELHELALTILSQLNDSLINPNFEFGRIIYSELLPNLFIKTQATSKHALNSVFLALYYFVALQIETSKDSHAKAPIYLTELLRDIQTLWKKELKFNLTEIFTYRRLWDNLNQWVITFNIETPNFQTNRNNLLYLYFAIRLIQSFLPDALPQDKYNALSWFSLEKRKEDFLNKIREDTVNMRNAITDKLGLSENDKEIFTPILTIEQESFDAIDLDEESENDTEILTPILTIEQESFNAIDLDEEQEFFDAIDYLTDLELDSIKLRLSGLLESLTPSPAHIPRATTQLFNIHSEEQLIEWINNKSPELLKLVEEAMAKIFILQQNNKETNAYQEEFTNLVSLLFKELSKGTRTSFKLPKELQIIQKNIRQKSNFPTPESTQEILGLVTAFLQKIDNCSFFSLTWLSHLWLYVTSSSYRQTYKNIRMTISRDITDAEKLTELESQFKVENFKEFKSLFSNPESTREIQDNSLANSRGPN